MTKIFTTVNDSKEPINASRQNQEKNVTQNQEILESDQAHRIEVVDWKLAMMGTTLISMFQWYWMTFHKFLFHIHTFLSSFSKWRYLQVTCCFLLAKKSKTNSSLCCSKIQGKIIIEYPTHGTSKCLGGLTYCGLLLATRKYNKTSKGISVKYMNYGFSTMIMCRKILGQDVCTKTLTPKSYTLLWRKFLPTPFSTHWWGDGQKHKFLEGFAFWMRTMTNPMCI